MNLKLTDSEKDSVTKIVTYSIKDLKSYSSIEEFSHLANLLYVYKKLTGNNYEEEVNHADENV